MANVNNYWGLFKTNRNPILLTFGILFSILLRIIFPETYYISDVDTFIEWGGIADSMSELYNTDCVCNYPIIGLLFSTGLLKLFGNSVFVFLIILGIIDALNVLLVYYILRKSQTENAGMYAGIIGILPSSWALSSFYGQIDNLGLLVILALISLIYAYNSKGSRIAKISFPGYLALLSIIFTIGVLSKQLLYFSLITIALLIFVNILLRAKFNLGKVVLYIFLFSAVMLLSIFLVDATLVVPDEYLSHLHRVALNGSGHIGKISGNGFNIWMLLDREMSSPSTIPFFYSLSPLIAGLALFTINFLMLTYFFVLHCGTKIGAGLSKELIGISLFYTAMVNLSFNLFLSGTHERYLIYFYPLIIIAMLIKRNGKVSLKSDVNFVLVLLGSLVYGFFVLGLLLGLRFNNSHLTVLLVHIVIYIVLIGEFKNGLSFKLFKERFREYLLKIK